MIGDRIKAIRTSNNLNLEEFGNSINVKKSTVSNWENNTYIPDIENIILIAKKYNKTSDYILELDNRAFLEVGGLNNEQLRQIQWIVNEIKEK